MSDNATIKKYILQPGMHLFAPGSAAIHCNENLSDEEAEWYIQRYPHIKRLFVSQPAEGEVTEGPQLKSIDSKKSKTRDKGGQI